VSDLVSKPSVERTTELQSKLDQAAKREPSRRFHALHDKLYLPSILQRAWELVRQNQGAAGIDPQPLAEIEAHGVPEFLAEIAPAVGEQTYRPQPVRRGLIPKDGGKTRPLGIPTVRDRVVQAAAKLVLEPIFAADFEGTPSFGFRPGLGPHDALAVVDQNARQGFRWGVDADIEQFFDPLDHQQRRAALRRRISDGELLRLIYRWLKAGCRADGQYFATDQGSPQGAVLSPLLANVSLHAFDRALQTQPSFVGRLVRYADDFVIQCGTAEHAARAREWARAELARRGLRLHSEKTRVVEDREGFDCLGFHHRRVFLRRARRWSAGVIRWPSKKAQQRFRERVRRLVGPPMRLRAHWRDGRRGLRKYRVGYCQYYRHGQSTAVFRKLDYCVECRIARNATRSQPTGKGRKRRRWLQRLGVLRPWGKLPKLERLQRGAFRA
jgi:RNA-directed DNA polymerase